MYGALYIMKLINYTHAKILYTISTHALRILKTYKYQ